MIEQAVDKRKAIFNSLGGKSLYKVSRAYALFIPRLWLRLNGWEVDGRVWVKVEHQGDKIIISPIDKEEAKAMMEVNDASIKGQ